MTRKAFVGYVVLPLLGFGGYFACLKFFPQFSREYFHSEHGAIERGTALAFFTAACIAARLCWKSRSLVPNRYRALYGLFAAAGLVVALEEVSYGQKVFNWPTPAWFALHNAKSETNLHNMFRNKPSSYLRALATVGCPVFCAVLPLWPRFRRRVVRPDSWMFHLLPQTELATIAALTIALTVLNKIPSVKGLATWSGHLGELKELYWGIAAACYANILSRRFVARPRAAADDSLHIVFPPQRRAA